MSPSKAKQPAVLIIVRHGARLDTIDNHWHLSSPTPYDPPLTYGGWTQSRALGKRIAELLDQLALEKEDGKLKREGEPDATPHQRRLRRRRIAIHSSPFLRCVQTSIAIAAGINLDRRAPAQQQNSLFSPSAPDRHLRSSSSRTSLTSTTSSRSGNNIDISPPVDSLSAQNSPEKCKLRLDAFLSEWLPHEYFEHITPPPESVLMLAGAKAELLRRADPIETGWSRFEHSLGNQHHTDPGVSAPDSAVADTLDEDIEDDLSPDHIVNGVPFAHRDRSATSIDHRPHISFLRNNIREKTTAAGGGDGNGNSAATRPVQQRPSGASSTANVQYYSPPTPAYAISNGSQIPLGYVAHARDACVGMDIVWDSMREPLEWGDGGELGEQWGAMHNRFAAGLRKLVGYYSQQPQQGGSDGESGGEESGSESDPDDDVDDVVILVSHGAGCNALIGALTDEPVLMDVPMTSLTLAVRKDEKDGDDSDRGSIGDGAANSRKNRFLSMFYDVRLLASTQHLRPPQSSFSRSSSTSNRGSSAGSTNGSFSARRRPRRPSTSSLTPSSAMTGNPVNTQGSGLWGNTSTSMEHVPSSTKTEGTNTSSGTQSMDSPQSTLPSSIDQPSDKPGNEAAKSNDTTPLQIVRQNTQNSQEDSSSPKPEPDNAPATTESLNDNHMPTQAPPSLLTSKFYDVLNSKRNTMPSSSSALWRCPPTLVMRPPSASSMEEVQSDSKTNTTDMNIALASTAQASPEKTRERERARSQSHMSKRRWSLTQVTDDHGM